MWTKFVVKPFSGKQMTEDQDGGEYRKLRMYSSEMSVSKESS